MTRPVLFLLPGLLCDATVWASQIAAFGARYDVRVPDFGDRDSIDAMAALVLDGAPDQFAVAGHSMGGRVALRLAELAPHRVARLALLDTGTHAVRPGEAESRAALLDLAEREGMRALAAQWLPPMVHPVRRDDDRLMRPLVDMVERMTPTRFRSQIAALLSRADAAARLALIACPTLVAVGDSDSWSPPAQHVAIAAAIPRARYVVVPDSGHMAPVEAPNAVIAALEDWLAAPAIARYRAAVSG